MPTPVPDIQAFRGRTSSDLYTSIADVDLIAREMLAAAAGNKLVDPAILESFAQRILKANSAPSV